MTATSDVTSLSAFRGPLLHFLSEPGLGTPDPASYSYFPDGLLVVADGRVQAVGEAAELLPTLPAGTLVEHSPEGLRP